MIGGIASLAVPRPSRAAGRCFSRGRCDHCSSSVAAIIVLRGLPDNAWHFERLLGLCGEVLEVCGDLGIEPRLSGSLAVFAYTGDHALEVHDIDLACSEAEFPRLLDAARERGLEVVAKPWHVLQIHRDGLKVEFDAIEYWFRGLPADTVELAVGGLHIPMVRLDVLRALYERGVAAPDLVPERGSDLQLKLAALAQVAPT